MVCVCPPHTSMNLNSSSPVNSVMAATRARPAAGSRNSSTNFIVSPSLFRMGGRRRGGVQESHTKQDLNDGGGVERGDLVVVRLAHLSDRRQREVGLPLVDLGHGESDVDQYPVAAGHALPRQQPDADRPLHTAHVDLGQVIVGIDDRHHLAGNAQTHVCSSQQIRGRGSPTSMSTIRLPPNGVRSATIPSGCSAISPITAALRPFSCVRRAATAASASSAATTATNLPSLAT